MPGLFAVPFHMHPNILLALGLQLCVEQRSPSCRLRCCQVPPWCDTVGLGPRKVPEEQKFIPPSCIVLHLLRSLPFAVLFGLLCSLAPSQSSKPPVPPGLPERMRFAPSFSCRYILHRNISFHHPSLCQRANFRLVFHGCATPHLCLCLLALSLTCFFPPSYLLLFFSSLSLALPCLRASEIINLGACRQGQRCWGREGQPICAGAVLLQGLLQVAEPWNEHA